MPAPRLVIAPPPAPPPSPFTPTTPPLPFPAGPDRSPWARWRRHFERTAARPIPRTGDRVDLPPARAAALASSLARFQVGETGEGRIVGAVSRARMRGVDDDYRHALALFIAEEGRHARILAGIVRGLGGELLATSWTARLFARVRRLAGIRFKVLAMFAAEVVSIGFYAALAAALPAGGARVALEQIARDEQAHLRFHRDFFRIQAPRGWRRAAFLAGWIPLAHAAVLLVLWDHRRALRTLGIPTRPLATRLFAVIAEGAR